LGNGQHQTENVKIIDVICKKKNVKCMTCSKIDHIPYNLILTIQFNDSSILITVISWDYLNLWLENEYAGDITIPTKFIKYNQCCSRRISQLDCSIHIKINYLSINTNVQIWWIQDEIYGHILLGKMHF
jgi:hypothetical protein